MTPCLTDLREAIADKPSPKGFEGHYDAQQQLALTTKLANQMGYDFEAGRIDISTHPPPVSTKTTRLTASTQRRMKWAMPYMHKARQTHSCQLLNIAQWAYMKANRVFGKIKSHVQDPLLNGSTQK